MTEPKLHACTRPDVVAALTPRAAEARDAILPRLLAEIPHYRTLTDDQLADVAANVYAGFLTTLELWAAGQLAAPEQLRVFRVNGATRAAEGRPLPVVLRAYRVAGIATYDWVVEHCDPPLDVREERNFARMTMTFVDQLTNEVTLGYVEATGQLAAQQGRARQELLEDLLAGRLLGASEVTERAATLGLALPARPSLVVATAPVGDGSSLSERAVTFVRALAGGGDVASLQLITRGQLVVIADALDPGVARRALADAGLVGVLLDVPDLTDLAAAYQQAREVHEHLRAGHGDGRPLIEHDEAQLLGVLARVCADERSRSAAAAILRDLVRPEHAALCDTLDAYLQTGNAVSAAHRLGIHAQTMRYRLRRVRELTGRDPAQGRDRFLLELALNITPR